MGKVSIWNQLQEFFGTFFIICFYLMVIFPGRNLNVVYFATDLPSSGLLNIVHLSSCQSFEFRHHQVIFQIFKIYNNISVKLEIHFRVNFVAQSGFYSKKTFQF